MQSRIHHFFALVSAAVALLFCAGGALAQDSAGGVWPSFEQQSVLELTLVNRQGTLSLYRDGDDWFVRPRNGGEVAPRADGKRIAQILEFLLHNKPMRTVGPLAANAAGYGLDQPRVSLAVEWSPSAAEAQSLRVDFGDEAPEGGVYAVCSLAPDSVVTVNAAYVRMLTAPQHTYYDRRIAHFPMPEVTSVALSDRDGTRWLVTASDDEFVFHAPEEMKGHTASASEVRMLLNNILSMRAEDMVLNKKEVAATPDLEITVRCSGGNEVQIIRLYGRGVGDSVYLGESTWQPGLFRLRAGQKKLLDVRAFALQERNVVEIDSSAVRELLIRTQDQRFVATRNGSGWVARDTGKSLLGIDMWLWRFNELRFEAEPSASLPESASWVMTCEPVGDDGKLTAALTFYADPQLPDGQCWLKVGQEEPYYPVSNQLLRDMRGQLPAANGSDKND